MCKLCGLVYFIDAINKSDALLDSDTNYKFELGAVSMLVGHNIDKFNNWINKDGSYTTRFTEQIRLMEDKLMEHFYDDDIVVMRRLFKQVLEQYEDTSGYFLRDILKAYKSH